MSAAGCPPWTGVVSLQSCRHASTEILGLAGGDASSCCCAQASTNQSQGSGQILDLTRIKMQLHWLSRDLVDITLVAVWPCACLWPMEDCMRGMCLGCSLRSSGKIHQTFHGRSQACSSQRPAKTYQCLMLLKCKHKIWTRLVMRAICYLEWGPLVSSVDGCETPVA
jgi:hypothetical protein